MFLRQWLYSNLFFLTLISLSSTAFAATEIGSTGIFFNNASDGTVYFYSDSGETNSLGNADPDDITGSVRPCDGDNGADGLSTANTLPVTLGSAIYNGLGSSTFAPSNSSGHCFYKLSNGSYVGIENMSDSGETSTIAASRIYACPSSATVTASGFNMASQCISSSSSSLSNLTRTLAQGRAQAQARSTRKSASDARGRFINNTQVQKTAKLSVNGSSDQGSLLSKGQLDRIVGELNGWVGYWQANFDYNYREEQGSSGTLTGKLGVEKKYDDYVTGFYIGTSLGRAEVTGFFEGNEDTAGISLGGYVVKQLTPDLYFDGYGSLGFSNSTLAINSGSIDYDGSYGSRTIVFGSSLTGLSNFYGYDLRHVGNAEYINMYTGKYFLVSEGIRQKNEDATTRQTNLRYTPEVRVELGEGKMLYSPSITCEHHKADTTTTNCGGGIGAHYIHEDELGSYVKFGGNVASISGQRRMGISLLLEQKF
ncbi:hypothetical protein [Terasakiella sp. SH-1]|uniref:hypothetical protein n=1 Tax=Terasakiella sp. SH-1 TaxID=2560057 RepID=UPI0010739A6D|nr:hypothetical protein [Terasakiella sp. SH-1]